MTSNAVIVTFIVLEDAEEQLCTTGYISQHLTTALISRTLSTNNTLVPFVSFKKYVNPPVQTDDIVSGVFFEFITFEQVVATHPSMATEREGLFTSQAKPLEVSGHLRWYGESRKRSRFSPGAS
ncbi:hypothetical protein TNCV_4017961 [Trichonephila clavipes]|nr:hypothetical protein TNCV_4017961 [Trichonephila clavipes]